MTMSYSIFRPIHRALTLAASALLAGTTVAQDAPNPADQEFPVGKWVSIFNGQDMQGWTPKFKGHELGVNYNDTFRVEDNLLKVRYNKYDTWGGMFGHLFFAKPFSHYKLRVEYRFVGDQVKDGPGWAWRNNGVMFHGQTAESMKLGQDFPNSIEFQLLGGKDEGERPTANLCTPGTDVKMDGKLIKKHVANSTSATFRGDDWVTVEYEVHGSKIAKHIVDGKVVLEYTDLQLDDGTLIEGGTISLQAESAPIDFRKIEVMVLEE